MGTGAVSPPEVETCRRTEWPLRFSEKYRRVPSVTSERLDAPSLVICSDEITSGGASGDFINRMIATNPRSAQIPTVSHIALPTLGRGLRVVAAPAKIDRILSFESGAVLAPDPAAGACPDSISRRRRRRSARISAALA